MLASRTVVRDLPSRGPRRQRENVHVTCFAALRNLYRHRCRIKTAVQLDSLVARIALYPDPLLAQVLAAATYPLKVVQAQRWLTTNSKLKERN